MKTIVSMEIPRIELVNDSCLDIMEEYLLYSKYRIAKSEFVLCPHGKETIFLNQTLSHIDDIVTTVNEIMKQNYLNSKTEKLFDRFSEFAGERSTRLLLDMWLKWRDECKKAKLKKRADHILEIAETTDVRRHIRKNRELIRMLFDIGFGLYREGTETDWQQGAENAFLCGYICALNGGKLD